MNTPPALILSTPFFEAFGWDVRNRKGKLEKLREVVHEDKVRVKGKAKAPDYSFRIAKDRAFFLEAKKPSVNLKANPEPAFQLRGYGWSAKLSLCVLTNFREWALCETRFKEPKAADPANTGRVFYCAAEELFHPRKISHGGTASAAVERNIDYSQMKLT